MPEEPQSADNPPRDRIAEGARLTVYYDGGCPLCRAEISYYRRLDRAGRVAFVDLTGAGADTGEDLTCAAALARFHVRAADGQLTSGAAAFVRLWRELRGWRWAAHVARLPGIVWLMERAYRAFLPIRPRLARLVAGRHRGGTDARRG